MLGTAARALCFSRAVNIIAADGACAAPRTPTAVTATARVHSHVDRVLHGRAAPDWQRYSRPEVVEPSDGLAAAAVRSRAPMVHIALGEEKYKREFGGGWLAARTPDAKLRARSRRDI